MKSAISQKERAYRIRLGLPSQTAAKKYLSAKDIVPPIDLGYVQELSSRVEGIVKLLNAEVHQSVKWPDIDAFCRDYVKKPTQSIISNGLLSSMNNQGRRPEEVFFSWLRGYSILEFFTPALACMLETPMSRITRIGDDDLARPETFRRTARADLEIELLGEFLRIEAQTGLQGTNDIKEHKVREARALWRTTRRGTLCTHFDIYNGRAAIFRLHDFPLEEGGWINRPQMEGQRVAPIPASCFKWDFSSCPPKWQTLS